MNYIQQDEQTFVTGVPKKTPQTHLREYVNNLTSKIDYAKWKQSLVLGYNYMPMNHMIEKIANEKIGYQKKLDEISEQCRRIVEDENMLNQLEAFRGFRQILEKKLQTLTTQINTSKLKKQSLEQQILKKNKALKQSLKQNNELQILSMRAKGITTKRDIQTIKNLKTSKSVSILTHTKNSQSVTFDIHKQYNRNLPVKRQNYQSQPKLSEKSNLFRTIIHKKKPSKTHMLYLQCLDTILKIFPKQNKNIGDIMLAPPNEIKQKKMYDSEMDLSSSVKENEESISWESFRQMGYLQILDRCVQEPTKSYKLRNFF